jgi:hypothetical protein
MSFDSLKENDTIFKRPDKIGETKIDENLPSTSNENYSNLDDDKNETDTQSQKYPKFVFLIILNEFCERFSYYGIRTVMFIFLTSRLIFLI